MKFWTPALLTALFTFCLTGHAIAAEQRWKLSQAEDEISGEMTHSLAVATDDASVLVLTTRKGKEPLLTLVPAKRTLTIFPDGTDVKNKSMSVNISMRSTKMEKPHAAAWRMLWMNYGQAFTPIDADLAQKVFSGNSVTVQFDKMGKRIKFLTKGEGFDGFEDALQKALSVGTDEPATTK